MGRDRIERECEIKEERKFGEKREKKRMHAFLKSKIKNIKPQPIILSG